MTFKRFFWDWFVPVNIAVAGIVACHRTFKNPDGLSIAFAFTLGALLTLSLRRALVFAVNRYTLGSLRCLLSAMEHGEDADIQRAFESAKQCVENLDSSFSADHNQEGWFRKRWPFKRAVAAVVEATALGDRK